MEQTTQQNTENQLPRKTKIAANWLVIAGWIHLAVCIIILVYLREVPRPNGEPAGGLLDFGRLESLKWILWDFGPPMGYLTILYSLLSLELSDLPLWIIITIPFVLPLLCIFFGVSLLAKKEWIKKKSGYTFIMIVLLIYLLMMLPTMIISLISLCLALIPESSTELALHFMWSFLTPSAIFIIFPPFILLYLDRKNFLKTAS